MVSHTGIEPVTPWLKVKCSTDWANDSHYGAGNEVRTRDIQLGRLTLYQLSYSRTSLSLLLTLVAEAGFEPTTFGLWARRATRLLYSAIFMVPRAGLEPARDCSHRILSPVCLPFHHQGSLIVTIFILSYFSFFVKKKFWCLRKDSNLRPCGYEPHALANWAT